MTSLQALILWPLLGSSSSAARQGRVRGVREGGDDWAPPWGTLCPGESMAACARRETLEEAGLAVEPARIAFVLESHGPRSGLHTVDLVLPRQHVSARAGAPLPGARPLTQGSSRLACCTSSICVRR